MMLGFHAPNLEDTSRVVALLCEPTLNLDYRLSMYPCTYMHM